MQSTTKLLFYINSKKYHIPLNYSLVAMSLAEFLREELQLTGTKIGCNEGGCGSCIVLLSKFQNSSIINLAINACLMPLLSIDGCSIVTIEGIEPAIPSSSPTTTLREQ